MNMTTWAEKEVKLACKKENPNWTPNCGDWDYGVACYQSALKAYKVLAEDEHSGFSWQLTGNILERLMRNEPLTPITDEDFIITDNTIGESEDYLKEHNLKSSIQCPRMSSLFRYEHLDGTITYTDVNRYYCYEINNPDDTYSGGAAANILDEYYPITMPYYPSKDKYQICCETFLVDKDMGDFDTRGYWRITTPDGNVVEVKKFFKEIKDGEPKEVKIESCGYVTEDGTEVEGKTTTHMYQPTKWIEITQEEFEERKSKAIK